MAALFGGGGRFAKSWFGRLPAYVWLLLVLSPSSFQLKRERHTRLSFLSVKTRERHAHLNLAMRGAIGNGCPCVCQRKFHTLGTAKCLFVETRVCVKILFLWLRETNFG